MGGLIKALLVLVGLAALVCVGGYFALKRADIPYETLASHYESADSRYIDLPSGVHMHYRDQGQRDGPTILLVHGYSVSLLCWEPWVIRLGDQYRVVSIDLPGHGLTRAPAGYRATIEAYRDVVAEFAHEYGLQRFAIAGNSMGGNVAWEYALAHPEQLDALILVDASGWPPTQNASEPPFFKVLQNPTLGPLFRDLDNTALMRKGLQASFANPALASDQMVTTYSELSHAPGHRDMLIQLMLGFNSRNFASNERLAAIHTPTLILVGAHDNLVPPADAERFHQAIAGSELVSFPDSGHMPEVERPEESATAVSEFLYRTHEGSALAAE